MNELQEALHKFEQEHEHLLRVLDEAEPIVAAVEAQMALAAAKRVRTASTVLVRALARHRDQATAQEGTST